MESKNQKKILVVGAGPVGLAAALFLSHKGANVRIIEKLSQPSFYSKALAINPRTLELLDSIDCAEDFIKNSYRVKAVKLHRNYDDLVKNTFEGVQHKFGFMSIQSQYVSEQALTKMLEKRGIRVERGISIIKVVNKENSVDCELQISDEQTETLNYDYVFSADGAHSTIRKSLGLKFDGSSYSEPWYLFDVKLSTPIDPHELNAFLLDNGFFVMIRVEDDTWRVIGTSPNVLDQLPKGSHVESINWRSNFTISHRIIEKFSVGNVFFGGDAAHVHSPAGGRGMNLGIEDAFVFAELYASDRLSEYNNARMKVVPQVVNRIQNFTNYISGATLILRIARWIGFRILPFIFPYIKNNFTKFVFGLDHELYI